MQDNTVRRQNDWLGWKPIASTATDTELDQLEMELGLRYPPLYRDFLKYQHFYELSGSLRWERHIVGRWQTSLRRIYAVDPAKMVRRGFIPFASECYMDAGFVCFDTRHRLPSGDCPVVFLDHEWAGTEKEICPMFSSAEKMFECLLFESRSEIEFIYHDEEDDTSFLPRKQELLKQFLEIDLQGAGGPARDYWTAWHLPEEDAED